MTSALPGIRILDLTTVLMGPFATQILGDLGADIIKIEPLRGDNTRWIGPARNPGMSGGFLGTNTSKRSLSIDLKAPAGRKALLELTRTADVLVYNVRPDAMSRLGLSYEDVAAINPRILYVGVFGYGREGRYAQKPAYDDLVQALTGLPWLYSQGSGTPPRYVPAPIVDRTVGIYAAMTILAGLLARGATGKGQQIDIPMFETFTQLVLGNHLQGHNFVPPIGPLGYARITSPRRKPYKTLDGYISIVPYTDDNWTSFFALIGSPELSSSDDFRTISARTVNTDALYEIVERAMLTKSTADWLRLLGDADIPAMPMHSLQSLYEDEHLRDVGLFEDSTHPSEGAIRVIRNPTTWSDTQPAPRLPAPRLGEHSREILSEAGFQDGEIDQLIDSGVINAPLYEPAVSKDLHVTGSF